MKKWPKTADDIAYELQGSCLSLNQVLENHEMAGAEDDIDFCYKLDDLVFNCETCGCWFEQSEMSETDNWVCEDCAGG